MVFRKKNVLTENTIIASATIHLKKFINLPIDQITNDAIMTDVKILEIYYPLQKQIQEEQANKNANKQMKRKILGQMEIQLSFSTPYLNFDKEKTNKKEKKNFSKKINKNHKQKKNGKYGQITDENGNMNYHFI